MHVRLCLLLALVVITSLVASAQSDAPAYQKPPQAIVDIMDAAPLPGVAAEPDCATSSRWCPAGRCRRSPSSPGRGLASPARASTRPTAAPAACRAALASPCERLRPAAERSIQVPADAHIALIGFSPDGRRLAFTDTRDTRIDLYVADVATGATRRADAALNTIVSGCGWLTDSSALLCPFVAADRGAPPAAPSAPSGPNIQENARTWRTDPDVSGSADERARREAVRVLRLVAARLRRRRDRTPLARRQARHRHRRRVTGRPVRPRHRE